MSTKVSNRRAAAFLIVFALAPMPWLEQRVTQIEETQVGGSSSPWLLESANWPHETPHAFTFRTQADADLTEWALTRFKWAGLQLPPMAIEFHDDKQQCNGYVGVFRSGPPRIDICGFNWDRFLVTPKRTILHELAHAWAHHNLGDDVRNSFLQLRGLQTWGNQTMRWEERGTEQAAEIIAWALIDQDITILASSADESLLTEAYELLTATPPPAWGRTPVVDPFSRQPDVRNTDPRSTQPFGT